MVERVLASMFGLILVFLLLSRSAEFVAIIHAGGDFLTSQTKALQGVSAGGFDKVTR